MQINKEPVPPSVYRNDISVGLEQIILRAIEKNPKKRYTNAMEMLTDIRALRQNSKTVFGNDKNFSRYKIIERKPHSNASNVSNRNIYPMSERGANFVDNQAYFKKNTSHSGAFAPRSEQINHTGKTASQTGRTASQTGRTIAITSKPATAERTQRIRVGDFPPMRAKKIPPATNTVAIDDEKISVELQQSKWLSILLWFIGSLLIVIAVSLIIWLSMSQSRYETNSYTQHTKVETEWNIEHTEKF